MRETRTSGSTRGEAIVPRHRYLSYSTATRPCGQRRCETTKSKIRKTNLESALESTVSFLAVSLQPRRLGGRTIYDARRRELGWRTRGGVCHVCVSGAGRRGSHTPQKVRCMLHPTVWPREM